MARLGISGQGRDPLAYVDNRLSTVPVVQSPRRPTVNDTNYPLWTEWRTTKDAVSPVLEGEFWKLIRFESNGDATWVMISSGSSGPMINIETDDGAPNVIPDGTGEIQIFGGAGISVTGQGPGKTVTISLTGGGAAIDSLSVDFNTAPGTDPVVPDGTGNLDISGNVVANGTNTNAPVATHSRAANAFQIDVQLATARTGAPANSNDAGLCSFDDTMFTVDANGFVQLAGGGLAIDQIDVQFNTAPGTDPVIPDGTGQITVQGAVVANGTNTNAPIATHSRAANTYNIEQQVTTTLAAEPADAFDAGIASFNSKDFEVDTNDRGYVSIKNGNNTYGFTNLGFSYASGTGVFTIRGADADLSADNFATVTLRSASSPNTLVTVKVTANQDFIDDNGASEIVGNLFGLTTGVAAIQQIGFYVYAVLNDDENDIKFMLSRMPAAERSPTAANIGAPDDPVADIQSSFWSLENIDETLYDQNPCLMVGSIQMTMSASDDWTVNVYNNGEAGIGRFNANKVFTMPRGQFGASNFYFALNGGTTAPDFNDDVYLYEINPFTRELTIYVRLGNCTVAGSGAVTAQLVLPYIIGPNNSTAFRQGFTATFIDNSAGNTRNLRHCQINESTNQIIFYPDASATAMTLDDIDTDDGFLVTTKLMISTNE